MFDFENIEHFVSKQVKRTLSPEVYLEHSGTSTMGRLCKSTVVKNTVVKEFWPLTIFVKKLHRRCSTGFWIYFCTLIDNGPDFMGIFKEIDRPWSIYLIDILCANYKDVKIFWIREKKHKKLKKLKFENFGINYKTLNESKSLRSIVSKIQKFQKSVKTRSHLFKTQDCSCNVNGVGLITGS